ncbi:MAG: type I restriction-modification system subunit M [Clostridia bacterium]|nr:type I restriction-modification system subunit M [Clostridia bacterium]
MTDKELKKLKDDLWHSADMLRASAHLAANKYGQPILGLIFLRYADILYKQHKQEIESKFEKLKGTRMEKTIREIAIETCGFYLPPCAYFDDINNAPDDASKATLVKNAMQAIEDNNEKMDGVLPKEVYGQLVPEEEPELLSKIIRVFKDIPENIGIDLFGEIYEYFLGNFALQEGKDGGTFYTPATVVRYMVEVLQPTSGDKMFLDPACGSGGMFVQAARYMHSHNASQTDMMKFRCYGVEKEPDTVKLAKMNLLLNNVRGSIIEANSFYSDPHNAVGRFDYVMANPPFNVDEVVYERVKDDRRFNTYGIPKNKSKKVKGDKKETVPNANYLWISYFASALNDNGKAALVMANSASDAGNSEYEIRKKLIEEGVISQMVTLPSNMFSSVTLPATLWFFDKAKIRSERKNEILFIDARNIFTQVDRAHRKFSDEQIKNLGIITSLYKGDTQAYTDLLSEYKQALDSAPETSVDKEEKTKSYFQQQIDWLTECFPEGKYRDVIGLCKVAKLSGEDGIKEQDYSLNAGRYVGVVIADDGMTEQEFKDVMLDLNRQFTELNDEAIDLEKQIVENMEILLGAKCE